MVSFEWDEEKNKILKAKRGICFEDVISAYKEGQTLGFEKQQNKKYKHQYLLIIKINNYAIVVPFVIKNYPNETIFLKTLYPSRRMTKKYIKNSL